jgi:hypothetical protein
LYPSFCSSEGPQGPLSEVAILSVKISRKNTTLDRVAPPIACLSYIALYFQGRILSQYDNLRQSCFLFTFLNSLKNVAYWVCIDVLVACSSSFSVGVPPFGLCGPPSTLLAVCWPTLTMQRGMKIENNKTFESR